MLLTNRQTTTQDKNKQKTLHGVDKMTVSKVTGEMLQLS